MHIDIRTVYDSVWMDWVDFEGLVGWSYHVLEPTRSVLAGCCMRMACEPCLAQSCVAGYDNAVLCIRLIHK